MASVHGLLDAVNAEVAALKAKVESLEAEVARLLAAALARPKRRK